MTSEQFTYWLQGFFEISGSTQLNEQQVAVIKEHLALTFNKVTKQKVEPHSFKIPPANPPFAPTTPPSPLTETPDFTFIKPSIATC